MRLGYLDGARGLAVLVMIHTHAFYSWVVPEDRGTPLFGLTTLIGGYPAALFLFLAGLSAGLAGERERDRGAHGHEVRRRGLRRALQVLGYAVLFRVWMLASGSFARPADLLRVDVLNCIGMSLLLVALVLAPAPAAARLAAVLGLAVAVAALTPLLWDAPLVKVVPGPLRGYLSGRDPDAMFPIFPWAAFAALGAAIGVLLARARARRREGLAIALMAAAGAAAIPCALFADRHLPAVYPTYDFWYTSPAYVALKGGVVLLVLAAAYLFDKIPGPSALRQLGRTSLLVYWVHLEIVYGQWVAPSARGRLSIDEASRGVVLLMLAMLALSLLRTGLGERWSGRPSRAQAA
jgi:uncharacterized membrane protein